MIFQHFVLTTVWGNKSDLTIKRSKVTYNHQLNKNGRPPFSDTTYQDSVSKLSPFWRRFLSSFSIYGYGSHLVQWSMTILKNSQSHFNRRSYEILWKLSQQFQRTNCLRFHELYNYIALAQGQITPGNKNIDCNRRVLLLQSYTQSFNH